MNDLTAAIFCISIVGGLYYFWFKCQIFVVDRFTLFMGILIWPVGALVGIYWAIKDFFLFRESKRNIEVNFENKEKDSVTNKHSGFPPIS